MIKYPVSASKDVYGITWGISAAKPAATSSEKDRFPGYAHAGQLRNATAAEIADDKRRPVASIDHFDRLEILLALNIGKAASDVDVGAEGGGGSLAPGKREAKGLGKGEVFSEKDVHSGNWSNSFDITTDIEDVAAILGNS